MFTTEESKVLAKALEIILSKIQCEKNQNQEEKTEKIDYYEKAIRVLLRHKASEIKRSQFIRMTQWIDKKERNELLDQLLADGVLEARTEGTIGRPGTVYRICLEKPV